MFCSVAAPPKLKTADGALLDLPKLKVGVAAEVVVAPNEGGAWLISEAAVVVEGAVAVFPNENKPVPATKVGPAVLAAVVAATEVGPKLNGFTAAVDVLLDTEPNAGGAAEVAGNPKESGAGALLEVVVGGE